MEMATIITTATTTEKSLTKNPHKLLHQREVETAPSHLAPLGLLHRKSAGGSDGCSPFLQSYVILSQSFKLSSDD